MKKCPACGYGNPAGRLNCAVCGRDLGGVRAEIPPAPQKGPNYMLVSGLILLACAALFYALQKYAWKEGAPAAADEEAQFSYEGVVYSLEKLAGLRYLPAEEKKRVLPLLKSADEKSAFAAAKAVGAWSRSEPDGELSRLWLESLLDASGSGSAAVRRQAALEAGFALALSSAPGQFRERALAASAALVAGGELELRASGFFLSSMAGLSDFVPQMKRDLDYDPSYSARLYAACALSRLGYAEGHAYLDKTVSGGDSALRVEALACLAYSASPDAENLLASAAADGLDPAAAASAKTALMFRKQLAIIKK